MGGDKTKIILSIAPPLLIIILLFYGGIFYGLVQSLGYQPAIGKYEIYEVHFLGISNVIVVLKS